MADTNSDFSSRAWLGLALVPGVALQAKLAWLSEFSSPGAVLRQSVTKLREIHPAARPLAGLVPLAAIDAVLEWSVQVGGQCLFFGDDNYPSTLVAKLHEVPLAVFVRGDLDLLDQPVVAFLGAPQPSERGMERARSLAHELAAEGVVIAAGVSRGIAQGAHLGAQTAGKRTIGVVSNPASWRGLRLAEEIANKGLLISELAPGQVLGKLSYARRTRLLPACARLAVVVEAPLSCDTMKLAADAGDMGCEVAAVPTDPGNQAARGCNALIRDGAALVETSADVFNLMSAGMAWGI